MAWGPTKNVYKKGWNMKMLKVLLENLYQWLKPRQWDLDLETFEKLESRKYRRYYYDK